MEAERIHLSRSINAWLATLDDQGPTLPSSIRLPRTTQSSLPASSIARGTSRERKWKRSISSKMALDVSLGTPLTRATGSATAFQNRSSPSPTRPPRKVLSQLERAKPSLRVRQPDIGLKGPPVVTQLTSMLIRRLSSRVIPYSLEPRLRAVDPDQCRALSHLFMDPTTILPSSYVDSLWRMTKKIYIEARRCYDQSLDESAWIKVADNVLACAGLGQDSSMLGVHSIQTHSIDPVFLPKLFPQSFARKVDLALLFSPDHPAVAAAVTPIYEANPYIALSQMTDAYTSTVPLVCCLEVKERGGDYNEAIIQLGVWCAAGLERLRELRALSKNCTKKEKGGVEELLPILGWAVIGHDWKFHIAWKDKDGNVTVLGPWRLLNAGTGSHTEILLLLASIRNVKKWFEEEYWPWLRTNVLDGLN